MDHRHPRRMSRLHRQHDARATAATALPLHAELPPSGTSSGAIASVPPIHRGSMVPQPWTGFFDSLRQALLRRLRGAPSVRVNHLPGDSASGKWELAAARRRRFLLWAVIASATGAATLLSQAQTDPDHALLHHVQIALYSLLFGWVTAGFVTAMMGFVVQLRGD